MCCLFTALVLLGPRGLIFFWWLLEPARWATALATFLVPLLGFVFLPWTVLAYVATFPGGIEGGELLLVALAVGLDVFSWLGGAYGNRDRVPGYSS
jgi:hypothetical protein